MKKIRLGYFIEDCEDWHKSYVIIAIILLFNKINRQIAIYHLLRLTIQTMPNMMGLKKHHFHHYL
jgi:hypothetical protein